MTLRNRQLSLSVFVQRYGTHAHAWRRPGIKAGGPSFDEIARIVQQLEHGKFDFAFFADFVGNGGDQARPVERNPRGTTLEPLTLVAALAHRTEHIGLVATVNTNFNEPYNLARRLASLDHVTNGRSGWNVVSSLSEGAAKSFGVKQALDHDGRYARAAEFIDVTKALWDSWDDDAFDHPNKETGVFLEGSAAHPVHHAGKFFQVDALLDIARPIQGYPVFFQAGNSDVGREFAAQYAEVIYAAAQTLEEGKAYYADVKSRLAKYGREPEDLKVTPGLFYFLGSSKDEAEEKYQSFLSAVDLSGRQNLWGVDLANYSLDDRVPDNLPEPDNGRGRFRQAIGLARRENLTIRELILRFSVVQGHRILVGTPKYVADQIEEWFVEKAADGFNLKPSTIPDSLDDFIRLVVPQLQKRGIFRKEYTGRTLRENLGLLRPANPSTAHRQAVTHSVPAASTAQAPV